MSGEEKKSNIWVWIRRSILILLAVLIGFQIFTAYRDAGEKLPMPFGYGAAVVLSGSMEPTFSKGDMIIVRRTGELSVGDIVVYSSNGHLVVHRVIELADGTVVTQGDANNTPDPRFEMSAVSGVVKYRIPKVGALVSEIKTPLGMMTLVALAFLLILLPSCFGGDEEEETEETPRRERKHTKRMKTANHTGGNEQ